MIHHDVIKLCCGRSTHNGCVQGPDSYRLLREAFGAGDHLLHRRHLDALSGFVASTIDSDAVLMRTVVFFDVTLACIVCPSRTARGQRSESVCVCTSKPSYPKATVGCLGSILTPPAGGTRWEAPGASPSHSLPLEANG